MEDHPHGCFPFSTVEDTLLRHTWSVPLDYGVIVIAALNAAAQQYTQVRPRLVATLTH